MTLSVNQLIGFGAGREAVETLIPAGDGTIIGNMNNEGLHASAFDGNTSQAFGATAATAGGPTSGYIGKDWGASTTYKITRFRMWSPNDDFFNGNNTSLEFRLYGNSASPSTSTDGTQLYTASYPSGTNQNVDVTSGITTTTAYRYHWIYIAGPGGVQVRCAEAQFYAVY